MTISDQVAERVARAIHAERVVGTPFEWLPPKCKTMYLNMARAAVAEYENQNPK